MKNIIIQLKKLSEACDSDECELIEKMVHNAADYVRQVVVMESISINLASRDNESYRNERLDADERRSLIHNGFIGSVNVVNRICEIHNFPPIYTYEKHRRLYGDFALEIVDEIFTNRS